MKIPRGIKVQVLTSQEVKSSSTPINSYSVSQNFTNPHNITVITYESDWILTDFWLPIIGIATFFNSICILAYLIFH